MFSIKCVWMLVKILALSARLFFLKTFLQLRFWTEHWQQWAYKMHSAGSYTGGRILLHWGVTSALGRQWYVCAVIL